MRPVTLLGYALVAVAVALLVVAGPLATIWAVNLLFGTAVPYTVATWAAVSWLSIVAGSLIRRAAK